MAVKKDSYVSALSKILFKVEEIYGLKGYVDGQILLNCSAVEVIKFYNGAIQTLPKNEISAMNAQAGKELVLLSYLTQRMRYFNKKRLDFSRYPNMKTITKVLMSFTSAATLNEKSLRDINKLVALLAEIDNKYVNHRNALAYRYLRLFIIVVLHGNYCNASVIADFILNQVILREDLR